ncbi:MAG: hypothetical protein LBP99_03925, partial [Azoarcus sp.]|nr:hypothetical protein [Azoarcus sp.]
NDYDNAIKEGKLAPSTFEKSARESGAEFYRKLLDGLAEADVAQKELVRLIGEIFEEDAPGFSEVREALNACKNVVRRLYGLNGGILDEVAKTVEPLSDSSAEAQASANALPRPPKSAIGPVNSRGDAIRLLREISKYFREHEPHNPVPLLTERAAKWAEMPLEKWLKEVIKEDSTMKRLDEMLGFRPD